MTYKPANEVVRSALLLVDVQQALFDRSVPIQMGDELVSNLNRLIDGWNRAGSQVIYIRHTNKKMLIKNTPGWQIHPDIRVIDRAIFVEKTYGNAFSGTNLNNRLIEKGINSVVIAGLVTHGCVQATCKGAMQFGYQTILVSDGHSSYRKDAKGLIQEWNSKLSDHGVSVLSTQQLLGSID